jgi:hypothetical protein
MILGFCRWLAKQGSFASNLAELYATVRIGPNWSVEFEYKENESSTHALGMHTFGTSVQFHPGQALRPYPSHLSLTLHAGNSSGDTFLLFFDNEEELLSFQRAIKFGLDAKNRMQVGLEQRKFNQRLLDAAIHAPPPTASFNASDAIVAGVGNSAFVKKQSPLTQSELEPAKTQLPAVGSFAATAGRPHPESENSATANSNSVAASTNAAVATTYVADRTAAATVSTNTAQSNAAAAQSNAADTTFMNPQHASGVHFLSGTNQINSNVEAILVQRLGSFDPNTQVLVLCVAPSTTLHLYNSYRQCCPRKSLGLDGRIVGTRWTLPH